MELPTKLTLKNGPLYIMPVPHAAFLLRCAFYFYQNVALLLSQNPCSYWQALRGGAGDCRLCSHLHAPHHVFHRYCSPMKLESTARMFWAILPSTTPLKMPMKTRSTCFFPLGARPLWKTLKAKHPCKYYQSSRGKKQLQGVSVTRPPSLRRI